jgi:hypothetical protein
MTMTHPSKGASGASKLGMNLPRHSACFAFAAVAAICVCVCFCSGGAASARAQASSGPQTPVKSPDIIRIPATPVPEKAPPISPEEIIRRFAAEEDALAQTMQGYNYRKIVRLQEFGADGKAAGQSEVTSTPTTDADGKRYQKISGGDQDSTLKVLSLERDALQALAAIPAFPFGSAQLSKYEISYEGTQPLDELMTYVFRVQPVQVDRERPYFDGLIWVDNHDLAIVKSYGKWVTETGPVSPPMLPFTMYETYRQPVANKYWMPAYSSSDGSVATKTGNMAVRLVIRWDQFAPAASVPAAAPASSEEQAPQNSPR